MIERVTGWGSAGWRIVLPLWRRKRERWDHWSDQMQTVPETFCVALAFERLGTWDGVMARLTWGWR